MHQENGWDFPDLQFLGGISVGLAVSAEHLVVVRQLLFLGEQPQTILPRSTKHFSITMYRLYGFISQVSSENDDLLTSSKLFRNYKTENPCHAP